MHKNLIVRLPLRSPFVPGRYGMMTGDALLGGILWETTNDVEAVERLDCLRHIDNVAVASALIVEKPYRLLTTAMIQSSVRDFLSRSDLEASDMPPIHRQGLSITQGDHRNIFNTYNAIETKAVWVAFQGDPDAVNKLLKQVFAIGKLRNKGRGTVDVDGIDVHVAKGHDLHGWVDHEGNILRPLPADVAKQQQVQGKLISNVAWCNPYHSSTKSECLIPAVSDLFASRREIRQRFH